LDLQQAIKSRDSKILQLQSSHSNDPQYDLREKLAAFVPKKGL
jgi:hypothetical protein